MQPDGDVHGPRDQVSPTLKVTKSAQEPRQSNQFPKLPTSLSRWSPKLAHCWPGPQLAKADFGLLRTHLAEAYEAELVELAYLGGGLVVAAVVRRNGGSPDAPPAALLGVRAAATKSSRAA